MSKTPALEELMLWSNQNTKNCPVLRAVGERQHARAPEYHAAVQKTEAELRSFRKECPPHIHMHTHVHTHACTFDAYGEKSGRTNSKSLTVNAFSKVRFRGRDEELSFFALYASILFGLLKFF